jgi:hypothetical protein
MTLADRVAAWSARLFDLSRRCRRTAERPVSQAFVGAELYDMATEMILAAEAEPPPEKIAGAVMNGRGA